GLLEIHLTGQYTGATALVASDFLVTGSLTTVAPAGIAGAPINLGLTDVSHGDMTSVAIGGLPAGWALSSGTDNGDGTWTVGTNALAALSVPSPDGYTGAVVLSVTETWLNSDGSVGSATVGDNVEVYAKGSPIFAWSGDDHLTASSGDDLLVFAQPIGHDVVHNFDVAHDKVDLIGFNNLGSFADVEANLSTDANGNA